MTKVYYLILALFLFSQCIHKKAGEKTDEDIALERFDGDYILGEGIYAKVIPMHLSFEVELQFSAEALQFFFEEINEEGNFIYISDDKFMTFEMKPDHKTGFFHEDHEESIPVIKE